MDTLCAKPLDDVVHDDNNPLGFLARRLKKLRPVAKRSGGCFQRSSSPGYSKTQSSKMHMLRTLFNRLISNPWIRYSLIRGILLNVRTQTEEMLDVAMNYAMVAQLTGDYFEFGVYSGRTFAAAYHISRRYLPRMRFVAFDSFQGLPEFTPAPGTFEQFRAGQYAVDRDTFMANLKKQGVDPARVDVVPGWFSESLLAYARERPAESKAAIIYVDCDLYESTLPVLTFITPYLQDGTLILFDDWFHYRGDPNRGEQRAFSEWLRANPSISASEYRKFKWSGNSFILHVRD